MSAEQKVKVIGISGPDGAGKGYLTSAAVDALGITFVPMVTTRPSRGKSEEKICVSADDYSGYQTANQLVGDHENKGNLYAYHVDHLRALSTSEADNPNAIIELNPVYQTEIAQELERHGLEMVGWIGLHGAPEYLRANIKSREPELADERIEMKLDMANSIMEELRRLNKEGKVSVLFEVGWDNRETMAEEFSNLVADLLGLRAS